MTHDIGQEHPAAQTTLSSSDAAKDLQAFLWDLLKNFASSKRLKDKNSRTIHI